MLLINPGSVRVGSAPLRLWSAGDNVRGFPEVGWRSGVCSSGTSSFPMRCRIASSPERQNHTSASAARPEQIWKDPTRPMPPMTPVPFSTREKNEKK